MSINGHASGFKPTYAMRPYQVEGLNRILESFKKHQSVILCWATGLGKCLAPGTPVMMFDGTTKRVENVMIGDQLIGPDSKPRNVLSLAHGTEMMYDVIPTKGDKYTVNESHILSLKMTYRNFGSGKYVGGNIVNLSVSDYLKKNSTFKHCAKTYRVPLDFPEQPVPLEPYYLGLWLGDGTKRTTAINKPDPEIAEYMEGYAQRLGMSFDTRTYEGKCPLHIFVTNDDRGNVAYKMLRSLGVVAQKHVPLIYKRNSRQVRMQVLAGLMDTDGSLINGGYDFISKDKPLAEDVVWLSRSLGLAAYLSPCRKQCTNNGVWGDYYRVSISGDCSFLPILLPRKKHTARRQKKDVLVSGIKVNPVGVGEYYGFEIDSDRLFLLGDFTVTHNTVTFAHLAKHFITETKKRVLVLVNRDELCDQAIDKLTEVTGERPSLEKAEFHADQPGMFKKKDIVVASVQTIHRDHRLRVFNPKDFSLIIPDECFPAGTPIAVPAEANCQQYKKPAHDPLICGLEGSGLQPICPACLWEDEPIHRNVSGKKRIEDLKVGDTVISWTKDRGFHNGKVIRIFRSKSARLIHIHCNGRKIVCTPEHPFYALSGGWKKASELTTSDRILQLGPTPWPLVDKIAVQELAAPISVYNFEVDGSHTYIANGFVVHNCHHSVAPSWRKTINYFLKGNPESRMCGLSATVDRTDGLAMGILYQDVAHRYDIVDALQDWWLVPVHCRDILVEGLDFSRVSANNIDLSAGELERVMIQESPIHKIVDATIKESQLRKTLVFGPGIAWAMRATEIFNRRHPGSAFCIHSGNKDYPAIDGDERKEIIKRYAHGEFPYLVNSGVLIEGFDDWSIEYVVPKPTKSRSLMTQMVGRGTRPDPRAVFNPNSTKEEREKNIMASVKQKLVVLDFHGNLGKHKLTSPADLLSGKFDEATVAEAKRRIKEKGQVCDINEELREARQRLEEAERKKRSVVIGTAKYKVRQIDPFDLFDIRTHRVSTSKKKVQPSNRLKKFLERCGISPDSVAKMDEQQAMKFEKEIQRRKKLGLCTFKQIKSLLNHGVVDPTSWTIERASWALSLFFTHKQKNIPPSERSNWKLRKRPDGKYYPVYTHGTLRHEMPEKLFSTEGDCRWWINRCLDGFVPQTSTSEIE